ncbi:MAG: hypothetical protein Q9162_001253, partial [Coniocarpon cinnabarinum]
MHVVREVQLHSSVIHIVHLVYYFKDLHVLIDLFQLSMRLEDHYFVPTKQLRISDPVYIV